MFIRVHVSRGATRLGHEVVRGAEATTRAIQKSALKIRDHLTPEETPSEVSPQVSKGLQAAKQATGGALRVSQYLGELSERKGSKSGLVPLADDIFHGSRQWMA